MAFLKRQRLFKRLDALLARIDAWDGRTRFDLTWRDRGVLHAYVMAGQSGAGSSGESQARLEKIVLVGRPPEDLIRRSSTPILNEDERIRRAATFKLRSRRFGDMRTDEIAFTRGLAQGLTECAPRDADTLQFRKTLVQALREYDKYASKERILAEGGTILGARTALLTWILVPLAAAAAILFAVVRVYEAESAIAAADAALPNPVVIQREAFREQAISDIEFYDNEVERHPDSPVAPRYRFTAANLFFQALGDYEEASRRFEAMLEDSPSNIPNFVVCLQLERCYQKLDKPKAVRRLFEAMLENFEENSLPHEYAQQKLADPYAI